MSEKNGEIVRRALEALNRGGPTAAVSSGLFADGVVWDGTRSGIPGAGVVRGTDDVRDFFETDWFAAFPFDDWEIHMDEPIESGDRVVFTSRQRGRGASSGAGAALTLGNIFTVDNGQIVRMQIFQRPEEAFETAGLSE
jgi:SnoaL-like domain